MTIGFYIPLPREKDFVGVIKVPNQLTLDERKGNSPEQPWQTGKVCGCMFMCLYMCVPAYVVFREQPWEPDALFFFF